MISRACSMIEVGTWTAAAESVQAVKEYLARKHSE